MSNRDTFQSSVKAAVIAKAATTATNEMTKQTTIDLALTYVGYTTQSGSYATLAAAVKTAVQAKRDSDFAAEQVKQAAIAVARDTLRTAGGDLAPV